MPGSWIQEIRILPPIRELIFEPELWDGVISLFGAGLGAFLGYVFGMRLEGRKAAAESRRMEEQRQERRKLIFQQILSEQGVIADLIGPVAGKVYAPISLISPELFFRSDDVIELPRDSDLIECLRDLQSTAARYNACAKTISVAAAFPAVGHSWLGGDSAKVMDERTQELLTSWTAILRHLAIVEHIKKPAPPKGE